MRDQTGRDATARALRGVGAAVPGLALVALAVGAAHMTAPLIGLSPLVVAVLLGAVAANLRLVPTVAGPGIRVAAKRLLRVGIVLLGFRLSLQDVVALGGPALAVVVTVVAVTFAGTRWMGRRMGVSPALSLLVATGFSICGASAIAAMDSVVEAEEEEVTFAIALVTLCGSLAIVLLPLLRPAMAMSDSAFGQFVGASVHDVAQVVATGATAGTTALEAAVVVKLTRVVLLAPLVTGMALAARRRGRPLPAGQARPPVIPLFVVGFLAAVGLRTSALVPDAWLIAIRAAEGMLLSAALFGLGAGVHLATLRGIGGRPLLLGVTSWILIAVASYAGVSLLT